MALSNKHQEWCRKRGLYKTAYMSKMTLYKLECLFNIDLKSKDMRIRQSVTLGPDDVNKVIDAMIQNNMNPLKLASVRGFGRKTVRQVEDLLIHHLIYIKDKSDEAKN